MSAIYGLLGAVDTEAFLRMGDAVAHRGQSRFVYSSTNAAIGQRSTLSDQECDQAYGSNGRKVHVLLDGEIINGNALAAELRDRGNTLDPTDFVSLVGELYLRHGADFPKFIEGPFAIAVFDGNRLLLARDQMGVKPLFYFEGPGGVVFGSQIKSIKHGIPEPMQLSFERLCERFVFGDHILGDSTYFQGLTQVRPGYVVTIEDVTQPAVVANRQYGSLDNECPPADSPEFKERIARIIENNVKHYMTSHKSVGVLLSGGFDSSVLAALAAKYAPSQLKTFTISDQTDFPDVVAARQVAEHLGTDHHEFIIDVEADKANLVDGIFAFEDVIYRDTTFMLAKHVKGHVDAVLSGACADIFGLPVLMRNRLKAPRLQWRRLLEMTDGAARGYPLGQYMNWFLPGLRNRMQNTVLEHFLNDYIPNQLFPSTERPFAYYGMEALFPYADPALHALARTLPFDMRMIGDREKPVLRDAFGDLDLPSTILQRPTLCSKHNLKKSKSNLRTEVDGQLPDGLIDENLKRLFPRNYTAYCFYLFHRLFTEHDASPANMLSQEAAE